MRIRGFMVILLLVMVITFYLYIVKTGEQEAIHLQMFKHSVRGWN